jgi:hypothetical protein
MCRASARWLSALPHPTDNFEIMLALEGEVHPTQIRGRTNAMPAHPPSGRRFAGPGRHSAA